jgi:threonine aldolase
MRRAMANAEVGDDLLGEDPSVTRLEEQAAKSLGKQAAIFLPSGSMANLCAILAHTDGRAEILAESRAHILHYEAGSHATLAGCPARAILAPGGVYTAKALQAEIRPRAFLFTPQRLAVIENTAGGWGGTLWNQDQTEEVCRTAHDNELKVHCDGARIFNAAAALKTEAARLVASCDSVMFSLSKGLSAPVGSMLVAGEATIEKAKGARKALGGAMRQSGVLAAAGLVALDTMRERLSEDHKSARRLAEALAEQGYGVDPDAYPTNMLLVDPTTKGFQSAQEWTDRLKDHGVLVLANARDEARLVTHRHITKEKVEQAIEAFQKVTR